mmetsp:Transcript_82686/g.145928  ORF Transcript_82686/g.145928 Transcript_82686/m.145928 type:complete len:318 (-) Transcript_82686:607-1560(-)
MGQCGHGGYSSTGWYLPAPSFLKNFAVRQMRSGSMSASRTATEISEPEKPSDSLPSVPKSASLRSLGVSPRWILNIVARALASGSGTYTRFSNRRRMAASISQGVLVAPSTRMPSCVLPTPCICTRNSVLMRRALSFSPELRDEQRESISSMKIIAGFFSRAISNKLRTSLSDSPCHLETRSEEETEKKVDAASVATALARYDLPVPGGPYNRMPFQGRRLPVNSFGNLAGRMTASFSASLAPSRPATSSHFTLGRSVTMALARAPRILACSASPLASPVPPPPPLAVAPPPEALGSAAGDAPPLLISFLICSALVM